MPHARAVADAPGAVRPAPPEPLSYEDFLAWADEDVRAEWVDGRVVLMSPASFRHQRLCGFLLQVLQTFAEERGLGVVLTAPFQMKTGPDLPGREPDLLFVREEHRDRLRTAHLAGPADLAVEVASPESRLRDRGEKLAEYEMGGVREYWLLDPDLERADFHVLGDDGRFRRVEAEGGVDRSREIEGLWLRLVWLWQDPPPPVLAVLGELGLVRR